MTPETIHEARQFGARLHAEDPWLRGETAHVDCTAPRSAVLVEVKKLAKDAHFKSNWMPTVKKKAGAQHVDPLKFLKEVWEGYTDALLT